MLRMGPSLSHKGRGARFAGYAALFDRVDRGGDVIRRGAFVRAVGTEVPLLSEHRPGVRIGRVNVIGEDRRGLRVIAEAAPGVAVAAGMGLSFGYRVRRSSGAGPRQLFEVDLVEVSLVRVPMQPGARVHRVEECGAPGWGQSPRGDCPL